MALPLREFCVDVVHSIPSREINSEKGINLTELTSPLFTKKSKGIDICGGGRMVAPFFRRFFVHCSLVFGERHQESRSQLHFPHLVFLHPVR